MTITAVLDLRIKPEAVADVAAVFGEVLAATRAFDGCHSVEVLTDAGDPTHLLLIEEWESADHVAAYRAWRASEPPSTMGALFAGPPSSTQYVRTAI